MAEQCRSNIADLATSRITLCGKEMELLSKKYEKEMELLELKKENEKLKNEILKEKLSFYKDKKAQK